MGTGGPYGTPHGGHLGFPDTPWTPTALSTCRPESSVSGLLGYPCNSSWMRMTLTWNLGRCGLASQSPSRCRQCLRWWKIASGALTCSEQTAAPPATTKETLIKTSSETLLWFRQGTCKFCHYDFGIGLIMSIWPRGWYIIHFPAK